MSSQTFQEIITLQKDFFDGLRAKGRSDNTLKNYKTDLDCFNHYLENAPFALKKFEPGHVNFYSDYLQKKYSSDNSRRRRVQTLRLFFDFLVEKEVIGSNPVRKIPTSPKFVDRPRPTPIIEIKVVWEYLNQKSESQQTLEKTVAYRNQVLFLLAYTACLKVSDLSALKQEHILINGDDSRVLVTPKRRDPYTIPLPSWFLPIFREYLSCLKACQERDQIFFDNLFFNANPYKILNGGLGARGMEILFEDWRKKLLLGLTPKSLRQAGIFRWLSAKLVDGQIKEWLGVAPSYSLLPYKQLLAENYYDDQPLQLSGLEKGSLGV